MDKYESLDKVISNENVIKILESAMLAHEDSVLAEVLEKSEDKFVIKVYIDSKFKMTYLAKVIREKDKMGINNWYVKLEGKWRFQGSHF